MDPVRAALEKLDSTHRDALVVLALAAERSVSRTAWQELVRDGGIVDERGRIIHGQGFKAIVDRAVTAGAALVTPRHEHVLRRPWLVPLLDDAQRRKSLATLALHLGMHRRYAYAYTGGRDAKRELLVALASGDSHAAERAAASYRMYVAMHGAAAESVVEILGLDVPSRWLALLPDDLRRTYLREACHMAFVRTFPLGAEVRDAAITTGDPELRARAATLSSLAGDVERARALLDAGGTSQWERGARAFAAMCEGRAAEARELFALAAIGSRKQRVELPSYLAVFDLLAAVTSDDLVDVADVPRRLDKSKRSVAEHPAVRLAVLDLLDFRRTGRAGGSLHDGHTWICHLVSGLRDLWGDKPGRARTELAKDADLARESGFTWVAGELATIATGNGDGAFVGLLGRKEGWELALDALAGAAGVQARGEPRPTDKAADLWWTLTITSSRWVDLEAHLVSKPGTKGKAVSFRALDEGAHALADRDRHVVSSVHAGRDRSYIGLPTSVVLSLVGHPCVRDPLGRHVRVELGKPKIEVTQTGEGATVRLVPSVFDDSGLALEQVGDGRVVVYPSSAVTSRVREALPPDGLKVPARGLSRLFDALGAIDGPIVVEAAASLARDEGAGDPRIHAQLFRAGSGLRARLRVVPGGEVGPALRPGRPPGEVVFSGEKGLVRLTRDLVEETRRHTALLDRCPTLVSLPQEGDDRIAADLESCLELLIELREAEPDVVVEWLEGQPLRAPPVRGASHMQLRVGGDAKWLSIEGHMTVDETRVVAMKELLESASRAVGRFLPIGDGDYLALTDDLRRKLATLARVQELGKDGRISTALLPAMDGIFDGLEVTFGKEQGKRRDALERARSLDVSVPRALQAELRDYQRDGFVFLARRAEAGLGACLADDMGLGKTVQALALLLHRRKLGPALVVAPMSVCRNWEDEARRFAPSLTLHRLAEGDREACVKSAKPGDVVIASYGLLASESELLASRTWGTVIYDEAHALKNASTRRWQSARDVKAEAVVALTGTPVENHAGELHALFELLVPGMLGSRAIFDGALGRRIADGDREAASLLRQIVRPFVLRRTKAQVLTELPPKTELLHVVPATPEHRAFYEAVRRRAAEKIEAATKGGKAGAGRARIELLAEIMRLRRAAIDPRLVGGADAPPGSKLDALVELVVELREEGRRALVFSQFLEVLDLARTRLDERGITWRRLDGTMTAGARAAEVAAFQGGAGDVFLISLKAGGVGMNLTAADVVILLDPWWNPAVEDQAAARAHRMGQARPVTVARIVTEGTIEERILALHAKKRQLFDDVVTDADGGGTLDLEVLTALLAE